MKVVTIVGARPQFIKCGPLSRELRKVAVEVIVHTGQHYDENMSEVFFRELGIPGPDYHLGVGSGSHGAQTGEMLGKVEEVLLKEHPDYVLVYGDTNSTLAGALAAAKLNIPVIHVEAGLRSFNRRTPEEINRVIVDHVSTFLFCPTTTAVNNLAAEGITKGVHLVGDVMYDALCHNLRTAEQKSKVLERLRLSPRAYLLASVHRAENTDRLDNLGNILRAFTVLVESGQTIVFPVHPRTCERLGKFGENRHANLLRIAPVSYFDMLVLEKNAKMILTDSGGVQREAYWLRIPCVTLRDETEWVETVAAGWNTLAGADPHSIVAATKRLAPPAANPPPYDGDCSRRIIKVLRHATGLLS